MLSARIHISMSSSSPRPDITTLTREQLIDRVFLLEEQLRGYTVLPKWGLTKSETITFEALRTDGVAGLETISLAHELAGFGPSTYGAIKVRLTQIRQKLAAHQAGYRIVTTHGAGWSLEKME